MKIILLGAISMGIGFFAMFITALADTDIFVLTGIVITIICFWGFVIYDKLTQLGTGSKSE